VSDTEWKPAKRKRITVPELRVITDRFGCPTSSVLGRDHLESFLGQHAWCECGCDKPLIGQVFEFEHTIPISIQHEGDKVTWKVFRKTCHAIKTTQDRKDIARAKRLARKHGQDAETNPWREPKGNAKIENAGFYKHPTKKRTVGGKVVDR
jgi:hypothetical protein